MKTMSMDSVRVTVLNRTNPRRSGTRAHRVYGAYLSTPRGRDGISGAALAKKGVKPRDLKWDAARKNIKVKSV